MMPNYKGGNDPRASAIMTMFNRNRPAGPAGPPQGPQGMAPQGMPAGPQGAPGMPADTVGEHLAEALHLIAANPGAPDVIPSLQSFFVALKGLTEPQSPQIPNPNGPVGIPGMTQNAAPAGPSGRGMRA
jgi:hypothetical protein